MIASLIHGNSDCLNRFKQTKKKEKQMSNISREDYDAVVAGLMTLANIESKSMEEGELAIKSSLILTDQLLSDLSAAKQKLSDKEEKIAQLALMVDTRDQEIAWRENEIARLHDRNGHLEERLSEAGRQNDHLAERLENIRAVNALVARSKRVPRRRKG